MDEMFGSNLFLSDKIVDSRFCDCEDECLRDRWRLVSIRFVLQFEHVAFVFCRDTSTFVFERLLQVLSDDLEKSQQNYDAFETPGTNL